MLIGKHYANHVVGTRCVDGRVPNCLLGGVGGGVGTLQGCNLYLTGLQALPYRVASSTLQGCKLYHAGL